MYCGCPAVDAPHSFVSVMAVTPHTRAGRVVSLLACRSPPVICFNHHQHRRISREGASQLMKLLCIAQLNLRHATNATALCPVFMLSPTLVSDLFSTRSETASDWDLFCARSETNLPPPKAIAKPGSSLCWPPGTAAVQRCCDSEIA